MNLHSEENDRRLRTLTACAVVLAVIAVVFALYLGRSFFVPIALAVLLNAVFRPVVRAMERLRVPAALTAAVIVLAILGALVGGGMSLQRPIQHWLGALPQKFGQAQSKLERLRQPLQKATLAAKQIEREAKNLAAPAENEPAQAQPPVPETAPSPAAGPSPSAPSGSSAGPAPPDVVPQPPSMLYGILGSTTAFLGATLEVLVLLLLMLAGGGMFKDKLRNTMHRDADKTRADQIVHESELVVLRYLLVTAIINVAQAVLVTVVMWWIGMPAPIAWGALTFVLEFVPYLGATVMMVLLGIVAIASLDRIGLIFAAPASYLLITTIQNNIASPLAYGRGLKLNPVAILIGVVFWWFVWGTPGAFLAVPILATLKVIADHSRRLRPYGEFLGA